MDSKQIQDEISLKTKELSITPSEDSNKRYKLQFQIKILHHQREIEALRERIRDLIQT